MQQVDVFKGIQMCARSGDLHAAMGFLAEAQVCQSLLVLFKQLSELLLCVLPHCLLPSFAVQMLSSYN